MPDAVLNELNHPFSFRSAEFIANPIPIFNRLREEAPVLYHPEGYWTIARHDDLVAVVKKPQVYSSAGGGYDAGHRGLGTYGPETQKRRLSSRDEPSHGALRKLMARSFTPRSIDALEPGVNDIVDQLIEEMREKSRSAGGADFVRDFAYPLAVMSMNLMLDVPEEVRDLFRNYTGMVDDTVGEYFRRLTRMKEEGPSSDNLVSILIDAARAGHKYLDSSEVHYMLAGLWTAGNWTTTLLLSSSMVYLQETPGVREALMADPGLVPGFVEESLRCAPPVIINARTTLSDVEIRGQRIPAGEKLLLCFGAANRDPRVFKDPENFDVRRTPNPHLSFNEGIHRCLGAPLARMETVAAFRKLAARGCTIRVDMSGAQKSVAGPFWGHRVLPVHFDA